MNIEPYEFAGVLAVSTRLDSPIYVVYDCDESKGIVLSFLFRRCHPAKGLMMYDIKVRLFGGQVSPITAADRFCLDHFTKVTKKPL